MFWNNGYNIKLSFYISNSDETHRNLLICNVLNYGTTPKHVGCHCLSCSLKMCWLQISWALIAAGFYICVWNNLFCCVKPMGTLRGHWKLSSEFARCRQVKTRQQDTRSKKTLSVNSAVLTWWFDSPLGEVLCVSLSRRFNGSVR